MNRHSISALRAFSLAVAILFCFSACAGDVETGDEEENTTEENTDVETGNSIFMPASGLYNKASRSSSGFSGFTWSSTLNADYPFGAYCLSFTIPSAKPSVAANNRFFGLPVRAVLDD